MKKQAQGNIFWIIISAVIALVVLVVLLIIFTKQATNAGGGLLDCQNKGGKCILEQGCKDSNNCNDQCGTDSTYTSVFTCPQIEGESEKICCLDTEANK